MSALAPIRRDPARRALALSLLTAWLLVAGLSCQRPETPLIKQVEGEVMCICPDECGKVLINCICGYSPEYRAEIQTLIDQGMSKDEILATWAERHGHDALAAPTRKGFDLLAWTMPFVALALAVPVLVVVIRRLGRTGRSRGDGGDRPDPTPDADGGGDSELDAQLDRELEELDR